ncbi:MAG TPA: hypothetical protein VLC50_07400 [Actinomycetes bacterium]|nr:hypothetical protein [Actinomycetes bacterium]
MAPSAVTVGPCRFALRADGDKPGMYVVEILDHLGDPAQFVVAPIVALDLALRAQRAGLRWAVNDEASARPVSLEDLRHQARRLAATDTAVAEALEEAERAHERGLRATLN